MRTQITTYIIDTPFSKRHVVNKATRQIDICQLGSGVHQATRSRSTSLRRLCNLYAQEADTRPHRTN
jgi:hypothetical protein